MDVNGNRYLGAMSEKENGRVTLRVSHSRGFSDIGLTEESVTFVRLTDSLLEEGITAKLVELEVEKKFDINTNTAFCDIRSQSIIKNLEDFDRDPIIRVHYVNSPFVEILGDGDDRYKVEFIDSLSDKKIFETTVPINHWTRCNKRYLINWKIRVTSQYTGKVWEKLFDLTGHRVFVAIESSALGDSLAWFPHILEFKEKNRCKVIVCTFKNDLYRDLYPELEFVEPGVSVPNVYAAYQIGWYYKEDG